MNTSASNNRIARNTFFLFIRMCFVMLISIYTTRVVLHVLGNEDYGVYNVVGGFVAMFSVLNSCFSITINRYYNYEIGKKTVNGVKSVYNCALLIQFVLAFVLILLIEIVGSWYIENKMVIPEGRLDTAKWVFHFSMLSLFLAVIKAPYTGAVMAFEKMDFFAVVSIVDALIKLGFVFLLQYLSGDKLLIYGVLTIIISTINFLLYFFYCRIKFPEIRLQRGIDRKMIKSMLSFSGWSLLDPAAYMARDQGTNMVLNSFFGTIVNAAQGISYQVAGAVEGFTSSFTTAFKPQIIQSYSEGHYSRTKNLMFSMSKICYLLQSMFVIPIIIEVNYILQLWLGEGYPSYTAPFICFVLVLKSIGTLNIPISTVVSATGNIKKIKIFSAVVLSSVVPIAIILFRMGLSPVYAYVAMLILTIINQTGCIIILHEVFPCVNSREYIKVLIIPILVYTIIACVFPLTIQYLLPPSIWRLLLVCLMSFVTTLLLGYFVVLNNTEKMMIDGFVYKFSKRVVLKKKDEYEK